jgi:hypothetical protein
MDVNPIDVQRHLRGVDYPASRDALVDKARANGASDDVVEALSRLPARDYDGPDTVMQGLGG